MRWLVGAVLALFMIYQQCLIISYDELNSRLINTIDRLMESCTK